MRKKMLLAAGPIMLLCICIPLPDTSGAPATRVIISGSRCVKGSAIDCKSCMMRVGDHNGASACFVVKCTSTTSQWSFGICKQGMASESCDTSSEETVDCSFGGGVCTAWFCDNVNNAANPNTCDGSDTKCNCGGAGGNAINASHTVRTCTPDEPA